MKHFYLYGEFVCGGIDNIDPTKVVCIFESAIDRLVAESYGICNGVDPGGALKWSTSHVNLLKAKGVTQTVTLFDGDTAGVQGSLLVGQLLSAENISNHVTQLPFGLDVAEILFKDGVEGLSSYTQKTLPYSRFKNMQLLKEMDFDDILYYLEQLHNKKSEK